MNATPAEAQSVITVTIELPLDQDGHFVRDGWIYPLPGNLTVDKVASVVRQALVSYAESEGLARDKILDRYSPEEVPDDDHQLNDHIDQGSIAAAAGAALKIA